MSYYFGILDGHDDLFGVRVPDLGGAYGVGANADEAVSSVIEAMGIVAAALRDSGQGIPKPRSIQELRADPAVAEYLRPEECFVALPLVLETGKPTRANISLDAGMLEAIDAAAKRRGITRSAFLVTAARQKIMADG